MLKYTFLFQLFGLYSLANGLLDTVPQTQNIGLVSTAWDAFHQASPSENITEIQLPEASHTGDANVAFPIRLPQARNGLVPEIAISYATEGGLTWLGTGWDLNFSAFTLDTKWGVPLYSEATETEIYLFDGDHLAPVFHRGIEYPREAERAFHLRQEKDFQQIIRHGSSPKNYWWEVKEKDGRIHYYGGLPGVGPLEAYQLRTETGNIAEWHIAETKDVYGNFIRYHYQKIQERGGINIYPLKVSYNGFQEQEGNYTISFHLKPKSGDPIREDIEINCRYGMVKVEADLLDRIEVKYKDQMIRSYQLAYQTGAFAKTLLASIAEYDQKGALFYDYSFEYHDDIRQAGKYNPYTNKVSWTVPKDNLQINPVILSGALQAQPTILGGSQSWNIGGGGAVTVGPPLNPFTKHNSVGPNGSVVNTNGFGVTALVDINSDGLPDKLWKENDAVYYRPNLFTTDNPQTAFGAKIKVEGISDFSKSTTFSWSVGAEANFAIVSLGYNFENSTTNISTYLADFNGDDLIDVGHDGKVYFNTLNVDGHPVFTPNSDATVSPILTGTPLDPGTISVDPNEQANLERQNPLQDVVRVWKAPKNGMINLSGPITLIENNSQEARAYMDNDGVIVMVQHENRELWRLKIEANDYVPKTPQITDFFVQKGEELYFRVHSGYEGSYDQVNWSPVVTYTELSSNEVDVNCLPVNQYDAAQDFLVSGVSELLLPADGTIQIKGDLSKSILSDTIYLRMSAAVDFEFAIAPSELYNGEIDLGDFTVTGGSKIRFSVYSRSNIDWAAIDWRPRVDYISFEDGRNPNDPEGNPSVSLCPIVDYQTYPINRQLGELYVSPDSGQLRVKVRTAGLQFPALPFYLSLKTKNQPDSLTQQVSLGNNEMVIYTQVSAGDSLYADIAYTGSIQLNFFDDLNIASCQFALIESVNTQTGDTSYLRPPTEVKCGLYQRDPNPDLEKGHFYRGWGQFIYDGNNGRGLVALNLDGLAVDTSGIAGDTTYLDPDNPLPEPGGLNLENDEIFKVMQPDPKSRRWLGTDNSVFLEASTMSASRQGQKNVSVNRNDAVGVNNLSAPIMQTKSRSHEVAGGVEVGPGSLGAGYANNTSWSVLDITDMNGDRFPDYVEENGIRFTHLMAGTNKDVIHNWGTHTSRSYAIGGGAGGSPPNSSPKNGGAAPGAGSNRTSVRFKQKAKSNASKARSAFANASSSIGISVNFTRDRDSTQHTFLDINGDGLEDKLWDDGRAALSLGYAFTAPQNWGFDKIRGGDANDFGGGIGFSTGNKSIALGTSISTTYNHSDYGFVDLNNDALIDYIESANPGVLDEIRANPEPLWVRFNTGSGFGPREEWQALDNFDRGVSVGESLNSAFTYCQEFIFFRVCFNTFAHVGQGSSNVEDAFADLNGDGFPDYLVAKSKDDNLSVYSSKIGRTNLLKSVHGPLGGTYTLDYTVAGNTKDMPFSKWVLSALTLHDGLPGDGVDTIRKEFVYERPYYDRHERQFYGFNRVIERHIEQNQVLRQLESEFDISSFYSKGDILKQTLKDGEGKLFQQTDYVYQLKDVSTGASLPPDTEDRDDTMAFNALIQQTLTYFEGQDAEPAQRLLIYEYDSLGNRVVEIDQDFAGSTIRTERSYCYPQDKYLVDRLKKELVSSAGKVYRQTEYELDTNGDNLQIKQRIEGNSYAIVDMTYDAYGNVKTMTKPENHQRQRLSYEYTYDAEEHQYLIQELNSYGYKKSFTYEPLYNELTSYTDWNGHQTTYTYDEKGRNATLSFPYESKAGLPYSVKFEYSPNAEVAYAVAHHFDPQHDDDLTVYAFEDGLHRVVQTKVTASLFKNSGMLDETRLIVSGTDIYDGQGRIVETYLPTTEPIENGSTFNTGIDTMAQPIRTEFDVFDRPLKIIDTYDAVTEVAYTVENDNENNRTLVTKTTNALGHSKSDYFNLRGQQTASRFDGPQGDIWTNYYYDGIAQPLRIVDNNGNESRYTYDLLGRRTSVKVPDAGLTELRYDPAGNLLERITATIRDVISTDGSIRYSYDHERLVQIDYPKYFQNKVQIHYGSPQDSFNRVGRIWLQEDATGGREYFFDLNGSPTKTIRTVMINRSKVFTYVAENEYDTWGRITKMKYPDGEEVTYQYHPGGQLKSMMGEKSGVTYPILKQASYDKFVDRVFVKYGNDVVDRFGFDNKGRLVDHITTTPNNTKISDENYKYDVLDNITERNNTGDGLSGLGGTLQEGFTYDMLQRMQRANGNWNSEASEESYEIFFDYDDLNNLVVKQQNHFKDDEKQVLTTRLLDYEYENKDQPTRPSEVGGRTQSYDPNGNLLLSNSNSIFTFDQNLFDEENRLLGHSDNGYISRYTYDAFGVRTIKSHGGSQGVFVNGAPAGFVEHKVNFKVDVSPYFTVYENDYRKHYFIDDMRILTRIGTGLFQTNLARGTELAAGGIDYKSRIQQYERSILDYYASLGVPPGPPTLLALLGQPEINYNSLPDAQNGNPYNTPPTNWPAIAPPDTTGPPGPPVFFDVEDLNREDVLAGYNFIRGSLTKELEQFYYHYDWTGSTHYVTNFAGEPRQYATYFPSGERWIYQHASRDESDYFYGGLTLDNETGMYDLGNIHYDPVTNLELSLDPVLQNFGQKTFLQRMEGDFYYDYFDLDTDDQTDYDTEILNSERPDPFLGGAINVFTSIDLMGDILLSKDPKEKWNRERLSEAVKYKEPNWSLESTEVFDDSKFTFTIDDILPDINELNIKQGGRIDLGKKDQYKQLKKTYFARMKKERKARLRKFIQKLKRSRRTVRFKEK